MTDRPINLTDWQVRAALDGRLSLVVEPVKLRAICGNMVGITSPNEAPIQLEKGEFQRGIFHYESTDALSGPYPLNRATGDRLWVREAWKSDHYYDDLTPSEMGGEEPLFFLCDKTIERWGWKPDPLSRWGRIRRHQHLPRWASRLTLIVTDVRVMQVQEINHEDAINAACKPFWDEENPVEVPCPNGSSVMMHPLRDPTEDFQRKWNARHAKRGLGWDANPWVTATTFTVHRSNIDDLEGV